MKCSCKMMHSKKKKKPAMYGKGGKMKKYMLGGMMEVETPRRRGRGLGAAALGAGAALLIKKAMDKKRNKSAKGQPTVNPKDKGIKRAR